MSFSHDALLKPLPQRKPAAALEILLLDAPPADFSEPIISGRIADFPAKKIIDGAGLAFEHYLVHGHFPHQAEEPLAAEVAGSIDEDDTDNYTEEQLVEMRKKMKAEIDHYELLGLGHLRYKSTPNDIRNAYRKRVLLFHPDKGGDDETFKKMFRAHDTLSNENRKRVYDSSDDFNDYFPSEIPHGKDFFTIFEEVFARYSKWSVDTNIPSLGDENTDLNTVNLFYKFWNNFQSWRDFSFDVEHEIKEDDPRDEKRWKEKQNKKGIEKAKKEEKSKIVKLVETAYRLDPRVTRMKEILEAEAEKRRKAREEAIRRMKAESEKKENAEKAKKEEEEKRKIQEAKNLEKLRNKQAGELRKAKDKMRGIAYANNMNLEHLEKIFIEIKQAPALNALCLEVEMAYAADPKQAHKLIIDMIEEFKKKEAEKFFEKKADDKQSKTGAPWTQEELAQLSRAVTKIPPGVQNRWGQIAELIPTRTPEQIIAKVQETKLKRPDEVLKDKESAAAEAFAASQKAAAKGDKHIASAPSQRSEVVEEEDEETKKKRLEEEELKKKKAAEKRKRAAELKKAKEDEEKAKKAEEEAKIKAEEEKRRLKKVAAAQKKIDDEKKKVAEAAAAAEAKKAEAAAQKAAAAAKKAEAAAAKKAEAAAQKTEAVSEEVQVPAAEAPKKAPAAEAPKKAAPSAPKKAASSPAPAAAAPKKAAKKAAPKAKQQKA